VDAIIYFNSRIVNSMREFSLKRLIKIIK